jgi:GTP-binding protein
MQNDTLFRQASFLTSASKLSECPEDTGIEVAFAGRSNAGKSSALNCITQRNALAKTSKLPGRTRLINFFSLDETRRLVDLPGYGYAKVSDSIKNEWQKTLTRYLEERLSLKGLILLMDIRHPLKPLDESLLHWAIAGNVKTHILLTKSDKINQQAKAKALREIKECYSQSSHLVSAQTFSSLKKQGLDTIYDVLNDWFET